MNYYAIKTHVSNSDLCELKRMLNLQPELTNLQTIFDFGTLVDMIITEPELVDTENRIIHASDGRRVQFDEEVWCKAQRMKDAALNDPFLASLTRFMSFQEVKMTDLEVETDWAHFVIPARCKYDGVSYRAKMGLDLKTTACTNIKSFMQSIDLFDYDQQAAWYMDLGGLDQFLLAGISKKPNRKGGHDVLPFAIQRGDETYNKGKRKYQRLAYLYKTLILNL